MIVLKAIGEIIEKLVPIFWDFVGVVCIISGLIIVIVMLTGESKKDW